MLSTGNDSTRRGDCMDLDLKALPPKAQVMYAHLTECLWPAEQKIFKSQQPEESA